MDPTPLAGALQIAAGDVFALNSDAALDEEEITFALLGAFSSTIPSMASWFPKYFTPSFQWQRYGKSTRGAGSEGATGADYALLIRLSNNFARAAIFQAKKLGKDLGIDLSSISPFRAIENQESIYPEPQILRLARNARSISSGMTNDNLDWVHFAAYGVDGCFCTPLSDHTALVTHYGDIQEVLREKLVALRDSLEKMANESRIKIVEKRTEWMALRKKMPAGAQSSPPPRLPNSARVQDEINRKLKDTASDEWKDHIKTKLPTSANSQELIHMLALGASVPPGKPAKGWLNLESKEAIKKFEDNALTTINIVQMSVAAELTLDFSPKAQAIMSQREKVVQRLQAATDEMKSREAKAGTQAPQGM
ncbi:hypothetical protein [Stenotrophomonas sp. SMYL86]|uniref:hypothetical protein n=1 Tax=Stenotrophomonas sp. SMYL86 TaxID=3076044 RepID=UPI002E794AA5|nr:hypothetical protein [Stenotrophomonas sp. SMYL86]